MTSSSRANVRAIARRTVRIAFALACLGATSSCGNRGVAGGGGGTDSNTHWLQSCTNTSECGPLSCICGACSRPCSGDGACGDLDDSATCEEAPTTCSDATPQAACSLTCTGNADCSTGATCQAGRCVAGASTPECINADDCESGETCENGTCVGISLPGRRECTPMDAESSGDDCINLEGYTFDGSDCVEVQCGCVGEDCDQLFASKRECFSEFAHCATDGPHRYCDADSDCPSGEACFQNTCGQACTDYTQCEGETRCFADQGEGCLPYVIDVSEPQPSACLSRCRSDDECAAIAPGLSCWGSACVRVLPACEAACPKIADECPEECDAIRGRAYDPELMCRVADDVVLGCVPTGRTSTSDDRCAASSDGKLYGLSGSHVGHLIAWGDYTECTNEQYEEASSGETCGDE